MWGACSRCRLRPMTSSALQRRGDFENADRNLPHEPACRNLHAAAEGLRTLSIDLSKLFPALQDKNDPVSFSISSLSIEQAVDRERRRPSKAKRRAWQRKAKYQRRRCRERLRPWQVEALFEADSFARALETPLNAFLTIAWLNTADGGEVVQRRFQSGLKAAGEWLRRRGIPRAWIYCHENPNSTRPNLHMLIHLPEHLLQCFHRAAEGWFAASEGGVHLRRRNGPRDRCLSYMVKGTDLATASRHGARARRQGPIDFKRAGCSESLGETARRRFKAV